MSIAALESIRSHNRMMAGIDLEMPRHWYTWRGWFPWSREPSVIACTVVVGAQEFEVRVKFDTDGMMQLSGPIPLGAGERSRGKTKPAGADRVALAEVALRDIVSDARVASAEDEEKWPRSNRKFTCVLAVPHSKLHQLETDFEALRRKFIGHSIGGSTMTLVAHKLGLKPAPHDRLIHDGERGPLIVVWPSEFVVWLRNATPQQRAELGTPLAAEEALSHVSAKEINEEVFNLCAFAQVMPEESIFVEYALLEYVHDRPPPSGV